MEETRRRNEASLARKRAANTQNTNVTSPNSSSPDSPLSPAGTGAMDSLLEKLRAAAPQARDQRDRRRRARLKDKHQHRIASGQKIPDMTELTREDDAFDEDQADQGTLRPLSTVGERAEGEEVNAASEGEDVADRAASLLMGLRGDGVGDEQDAISKDGSLRVRRRRESANDERRTRRGRRAAAGSSTGGGSESSIPELRNPIPEEPAAEEEEDNERHRSKHDSLESSGKSVNTPTTLISPPTPEGSEKRPVEIED